MRRLVGTLLVAFLTMLAVPSITLARDGCAPGWDLKEVSGFPEDRNGNGLVCTSRLANQFGPGMPVFTDDVVPDEVTQEPPPSFSEDPPPPHP
jgi:hypothetical protein